MYYLCNFQKLSNVSKEAKYSIPEWLDPYNRDTTLLTLMLAFSPEMHPRIAVALIVDPSNFKHRLLKTASLLHKLVLSHN